MLVIMLAVIVITSLAGALHPASNVEVIDPRTLHLDGEFLEIPLLPKADIPQREWHLRLVPEADERQCPIGQSFELQR